MQSEAEQVDDRRWFALQTRSRHEKVVRDELLRRDIENFLPLMTRLRQWTDRKKKIEFPLFSGYCFARFSLDARLPVLQTTGVVRIIGRNGRPESIPAPEIESLMIVMNNRAQYQYAVHPFLKEGMLVEVVSGPFQGVKGRVVRQDKHCRIVISISLIQQAVAVEIDASCIVPVSTSDVLPESNQHQPYHYSGLSRDRSPDRYNERFGSHQL